MSDKTATLKPTQPSRDLQKELDILINNISTQKSQLFADYEIVKELFIYLFPGSARTDKREELRRVQFVKSLLEKLESK